MDGVIQMVAEDNTEELKSLNQYNVFSAFFNLGYGGCPFGVFSAACPVEPLHSLENGLFLDMLNILFKEKLKPAHCAALDTLVKSFCKLPRQKYLSGGADKDMPRLLWKDGVTTLSDLSASYKVGVYFTIVVLSLTQDGKKLFAESLGEDGTQKMQYVFQMFLCYWKWLKKITGN